MAFFHSACSMAFSSTTFVIADFVRTTRADHSHHNLLHDQAAVVAGMVLLQSHAGRRYDVYNILWVVVFGFATLNILGLAARRFEPTRRGMSFGEILAVLVVLLSLFLLGWEMLNLLHIFPIRLRR